MQRHADVTRADLDLAGGGIEARPPVDDPVAARIDRREPDAIGPACGRLRAGVRAALTGTAATGEHAAHPERAEQRNGFDVGAHERVHRQLVDDRRPEADDPLDGVRPANREDAGHYAAAALTNDRDGAVVALDDPVKLVLKAIDCAREAVDVRANPRWARLIFAARPLRPWANRTRIAVVGIERLSAVPLKPRAGPHRLRAMVVQWVHLGDEVLVASTRGARIGRADVGSMSFLQPMPGGVAADPETTRQLLDGAIAAAERLTPSRGSAPERITPRLPQPPITSQRWAWHLAGQWYSARHSIALMPAAAERFTRDGRADLARFARQKLADEHDHDQLPLADLRALGYDAEALVDAVPPDPAVVAGIDYARGTLEGEWPTEFLGYMYALERRMARIPESWFLELERTLPAGAEATAGLRSHATALDRQHVEQAVAFFATLSAEDRTAVATGCHRITQIRCAGLTGPQPSQAQLEAWISPFAIGDARTDEDRQTQTRGEHA